MPDLVLLIQKVSPVVVDVVFAPRLLVAFVHEINVLPACVALRNAGMHMRFPQVTRVICNDPCAVRCFILIVASVRTQVVAVPVVTRPRSSRVITDHPLPGWRL